MPLKILKILNDFNQVVMCNPEILVQLPIYTSLRQIFGFCKI